MTKQLNTSPEIIPGETSLEAAIREAHEETGLTVKELRKHGHLMFYFGQGTDPDWVVYVFSTFCFNGTLDPSEEGFLKWFHVSKIPYEKMWEDDKHWLPYMLEGKRFHGVRPADPAAHLSFPLRYSRQQLCLSDRVKTGDGCLGDIACGFIRR